MKNYILIIALGLTPFFSFSQNNLLSKKLYHDVYEPAQVIDSIYGINRYENLNFYLGGDSIRNCVGYACTGWVSDFYTNDQLLHKGFYEDGKLKMYKNYYPDGKLERDFRAVDDFRCKHTIYHPNGNLKAEIEYREGNPTKYNEFYDDGKPESSELMDKNGEYYTKKISWFKNGQIESQMVMTDKKEFIYSQIDYHENGKTSAEGKVKYSPILNDYVKIEMWKYFDENGKQKKQEEYLNGKMHSSKDY
jgi:antitoxin component YwqK of YwqJK toxin-antitoxin module